MDLSALTRGPSNLIYDDPPDYLNAEQREAFLFWRHVYQKHSHTWSAEEREDWFMRLIRFTKKMPGSSHVGALSDHPVYRQVRRGKCGWPHFIFLDIMFGPRAGESQRLRNVLHSKYPGIVFPLCKGDWPKGYLRTSDDGDRHMDDLPMEPDGAFSLQEALPHAKEASRRHLHRGARLRSQKLIFSDVSSDDSHDASEDPIPSCAPVMDTRGDDAAQQVPATDPCPSNIAQPENTDQEASNVMDISHHGPLPTTPCSRPADNHEQGDPPITSTIPGASARLTESPGASSICPRGPDESSLSPHRVQRAETADLFVDGDIRDNQTAPSSHTADDGCGPPTSGSGQGLQCADPKLFEFHQWLAAPLPDSDVVRDCITVSPYAVRAVCGPRTDNIESVSPSPRPRARRPKKSEEQYQRRNSSGMGALHRGNSRPEPSKKTRYPASRTTPTSPHRHVPATRPTAAYAQSAGDRAFAAGGLTPRVETTVACSGASTTFRSSATAHRTGGGAPTMESFQYNVKKIGVFNDQISRLIDNIKSLSEGGSDGNTHDQAPDADAFRGATMYLPSIEYFASCIMERARAIREQTP